MRSLQNEQLWLLLGEADQYLHSCAGWMIPSSFTEFLQNKDAEQFREEAAGALTVTLHTHSKRWLQSQGAAGDGTSGGDGDTSPK